MAYGLRIKKADGTIILDVTDKITRFRYSTIANADADGSIVLADISGLTTAEFSVALEPGKCAHNVTRSGTTISWTAQSEEDIIDSAQSLIFVFLYT